MNCKSIGNNALRTAVALAMIASLGGCSTLQLDSALRRGINPLAAKSATERDAPLDKRGAKAAVLRLDAERNETQCEQALDCWRRGKGDMARSMLRQVLDRDAEHATARRLWADMTLEDGDAAEAEKMLTQLAQEHPHDKAVLSSLAWLYESQDRESEATALFNRLHAPAESASVPGEAPAESMD